MTELLEQLRQEVSEVKTTAGSAVALIRGLKDQIGLLVRNATDLETLKAELGTLSNALSESTDELASAVINATPEAPNEGQPKG